MSIPHLQWECHYFLVVLDSLDTATLSRILIILMVLLFIAAVSIVWFVNKASRRVMWLALVCVGLLGSFAFRSQLSACSEACNCRILARDLNVTACVAGRTQVNQTGQINQTGQSGQPATTVVVNGATGTAGQRTIVDGANETVRTGP